MSAFSNQGRTQADAGGATAEFAIILPTVALLAALLIGIAAQQMQAGALAQKVGLLARAVELGRSDQQLLQLAKSMGVGAAISNRNGLVCIGASTAFRALGFALGSAHEQACALRPGY